MIWSRVRAGTSCRIPLTDILRPLTGVLDQMRPGDTRHFSGRVVNYLYQHAPDIPKTIPAQLLATVPDQTLVSIAGQFRGIVDVDLPPQHFPPDYVRGLAGTLYKDRRAAQTLWQRGWLARPVSVGGDPSRARVRPISQNRTFTRTKTDQIIVSTIVSPNVRVDVSGVSDRLLRPRSIANTKEPYW